MTWAQREQKESRKEKDPRICPRCGTKYSYIEEREVNGRRYYYAVHYRSENGKRVKKKCYLGADIYEYVNRLHGDMFMVRGLVERNPVEYLREILDYIVNQSSEVLKQDALAIIKEYISRLESVD